MLFCHGKGANLSHQQHNIEVLRQTLSESVLVFDYPGFGRSEGQPNEAGCYAAADAAYEWLAQRVPAQRIVLFGESLGGGVATDLAVRQPHGALVLVKTFSSLPEVAQHRFPVVPALWMVRNRFDNLAKIGKCSSPIFAKFQAGRILMLRCWGRFIAGYRTSPSTRIFSVPKD